MDNTQKGAMALLITLCIFLGTMGLQSTTTATVLPDDEYAELTARGEHPIATVCQTQNTITYVTSIVLLSSAVGISIFMVAQQFNKR